MTMAEVKAILEETDPAKTVAAVLRDGPGRPRKGEEKPCEHKDIAYGTVEHWVARLDRDRGRGARSAWRRPQEREGEGGSRCRGTLSEGEQQLRVHQGPASPPSSVPAS
jgi:hypothetical protein